MNYKKKEENDNIIKLYDDIMESHRLKNMIFNLK